MFQLYADLLSINAKYTWNKIVHKHTTSKPYTGLQGCYKKGPGVFCASYLMTAWCSTFSTCFQMTRLGKSATTYQTCSRSPSASAYISLCSTWSSSTPTLCSCLAGTTAKAPSPVQFPWMCRKPRLIWWVTFFGCAHIHSRISSNFMREVWYPCTHICFTCFLMPLSTYVAKKYPMHNPTRKLPTRAKK